MDFIYPDGEAPITESRVSGRIRPVDLLRRVREIESFEVESSRVGRSALSGVETENQIDISEQISQEGLLE